MSRLTLYLVCCLLIIGCFCMMMEAKKSSNKDTSESKSSESGSSEKKSPKKAAKGGSPDTKSPKKSPKKGSSESKSSESGSSEKKSKKAAKGGSSEKNSEIGFLRIPLCYNVGKSIKFLCNEYKCNPQNRLVRVGYAGCPSYDQNGKLECLKPGLQKVGCIFCKPDGTAERYCMGSTKCFKPGQTEKSECARRKCNSKTLKMDIVYQKKGCGCGKVGHNKDCLLCKWDGTTEQQCKSDTGCIEAGKSKTTKCVTQKCNSKTFKMEQVGEKRCVGLKGCFQHYESEIDNCNIHYCDPRTLTMKYGGKDVNDVAYKKPTEQSSTYPHHRIRSDSKNAVDMGMGAIWRYSNCAATKQNGDAKHWWKVDMGKVYEVHSLSIRPRADLIGTSYQNDLRNFDIDVLGADPPHTAKSCKKVPGSVPSGKVAYLDCDKPVSGRYVRITKNPGFLGLTLCQVRVYACFKEYKRRFGF